MNRAQKIALLNQVLHGRNQDASRERITQALEMQGRSLILIDDLDDPTGPMGEDSTVHFHDKGQQHCMTLGEAHRYARRNYISTLLVLPTNSRP